MPQAGIEVLDCDKCDAFEVFGPNGQRQESPDFLVYLSIPPQAPVFCLVEFKPQPDTHAINQFKAGLDVLQQQQTRFAVMPKPNKLDCVLAYDRSKGMAHAAQVAVILGTIFYYAGKPSKIRFVHWGKQLFADTR